MWLRGSRRPRICGRSMKRGCVIVPRVCGSGGWTGTAGSRRPTFRVFRTGLCVGHGRAPPSWQTARMDDVTRTITFYGEQSAPVSALEQFLERRGVRVERVDWSPPEEGRSLGSDVNNVVVQMVATGGVLAITAGVKQFREWFRHGRYRVKVEGEADDDDAEPDGSGRSV